MVMINFLATWRLYNNILCLVTIEVVTGQQSINDNIVCDVQQLQVAKLLYYLSGLSTATSDEPATAKAELMTNVAGISSYFKKLGGAEVLQIHLSAVI